MATFSFSPIATITFRNLAIDTYLDNAWFTNDMCQFKSDPNGGATWRVPVFGATTAAHSADGSDLIGGASYAPSAVDVTPFTNPLKVTESFKWSDLSTNEAYILNRFAQRASKDVAITRSAELTNVLVKAAKDRAANAGYTELAGASVTSVLSDSVMGDGFYAALNKLRAVGCDPNDIYAILRPEYFYALRRLAPFASSDYIKSGMTDNATMNGVMKFAGVTILNVAGSYLGTDQSANTGIDSTARIDATYDWGVMFDKAAMAVLEVEPFTARTDSIPHASVEIVQVRTHYGAKILQSSGIQLIGNRAA